MSRQTDLHQLIIDDHGLIKSYVAIFQSSNDPRELLRAKQQLLDLWPQAVDHLTAYRRLVDPLPGDIAFIARYIDAGIPAEILNWQPADELLSRRPHFPLQRPAHAAPGGKTLALAQEVIAGGKTVYTLDHPANAPLRQIGAQVWEQDGMTR